MPGGWPSPRVGGPAAGALWASYCRAVTRVCSCLGISICLGLSPACFASVGTCPAELTVRRTLVWGRGTLRGAWLASTAVSFLLTRSPPWALSSGWRRVWWLGLGRSRWWIAPRSSAPASWLGAPSPGGVYPPLSLPRAPRDPKMFAAQEVPRVPTLQVLLIHPLSLRRRRRLEARSLHGGTIPREGRPVP